MAMASCSFASSSTRELAPALFSGSTSFLSLQPIESGRRIKTSWRWKPTNPSSKSSCICSVMGIPGPIPAAEYDPFLARLAAAASSPVGQSQSTESSPPLLDIFASPTLMAAPGQAERSAAYNEHKPRRPPPDLPSLLLNSRIVYIGMPLVPAVTELVIAELLYLQWLDPRQPTYVYINSTGTSRADGETVGMETEGFAIYDTMMLVKNEIQTVAVGAAIGQACLLLSAGTKGKRYMLPHATAMIQQPRLPSTGQMPAIDVHIRAKEVVNNRDTLVKLLAKHTGNSFEKVSKVMQRPFYMDPRKAIEFGVADKVAAMRSYIEGPVWLCDGRLCCSVQSRYWKKGAVQFHAMDPRFYGGDKRLCQRHCQQKLGTRKQESVLWSDQ